MKHVEMDAWAHAHKLAHYKYKGRIYHERSIEEQKFTLNLIISSHHDRYNTNSTTRENIKHATNDAKTETIVL